MSPPQVSQKWGGSKKIFKRAEKIVAPPLFLWVKFIRRYECDGPVIILVLFDVNGCIYTFHKDMIFTFSSQ